MITTGTGCRKRASWMELEPRLMFDGAAVATVAAEATAEDPAQDAPDAPSTPASPTEEADDGQSVAEALVALGAPAAGQEAPRQVVIVDGGITDRDGILKAVPADADVYVLPSDADGVAMIATILGQYNDLEAVHVVSHGQDGGVMLGTATLDADSAASHAEALGRWGGALADSGDILLYGCATGSGAEGVAFLQTLADLTGADIAASDDATGASALGGDWDLEHTSGTIDADAIKAEAFSGLLVTTPVNGKADFGTRYNMDSFNNPYSTSFTSGNINDLGWIAKITPSSGQTASLFVDDGGTLSWRGNDPNTDDAKIAAMSLLTASGADIDLLQLKIDTGYPATVTLTGFRNSSAVSGYSQSVSVPYGGATVVLAWENVDEIRFSLSNYASNQFQVFSISEVTTGPVPALTGTLLAGSNSLEEGADGALALGDLAFSHSGVATTNLTISANGGTLSATSSGNVIVTGSGTGALTLAGSAADIDAWLNGSTNITYNSLVLHGANALALSFSTTYEGVVLDLGTKTVDVAEVAQPARFTTLPDSFAGRVSVAKALDFSAADLFDRDSDSVDFKLTLSVASGKLDVTGTDGVTVTGQGTGTLVVAGKPTAVEAWLNTATHITHTGTTEGTTTLTLSGTDSDTGDYAIGTVDINVLPANTAPAITGVPTTITLTEDIAGALDLSALAITDADSPGVFKINIDAHFMRIGATSADGVTATVSGNRYLELTGTVAALTAYLKDASRLSLTTSADSNGTPYTTMVMTVDDGDDNIVTFNIQVDITPVDDPSTLTGSAGPFTVAEDSTGNTLDLSGLVFADTDAGTHSLILSVKNGNLAIAAITGLTIENNNTNTVTITGTTPKLNDFLDKSHYGYFRYQPDANLSGAAADTLTISNPDGSGGATALMTGIVINVTGVNDAPTLTNLPTSITVTENQLTPLDLSGAVLEDADSTGSNFQLTLYTRSTRGFLFAPSADGVTVTGSGTRTMVLSGSVADIKAFLALSDRVTYQSAPNAADLSSDRIQFKADDGDGGTLPDYPVITVTATDGTDIPTLSGDPMSVSAIEDTQKVIDLSALTLTNGGAAPTATLELEVWVGRGTLGTAAFGGAAQVTGMGTGALKITGTFTDLTAWLASATAVTYEPEHNLFGNKADALTVKISDGAAANGATIWSVPITISSVNDKPAPTGFPTTVTAATNTAGALDLSNVKFNDPDPDTDMVNATLAVASGKLDYTGAAPPFTVNGKGTLSLALIGQKAAVEAYLTGGWITYTPPADSQGANIDTLTLTVSETSGSVAGGSATITVAPPNAAPTVTGLPASVTGTEDAAFAVDLSAATLGDVDSPDADFVLTLAVNGGTLAATSAGGVTVGGTGSGTLTLTGTVTAIGTYLGSATAVTYTGAANVYGTGAATLTVTADDGDGNSGVALGTVQINLTEVNDPAGATSLPTSVTAAEDTLSGLTLSGVVLSTVDPVDGDHKLVLSVDVGTLAATASGGVTVTGSGTGTLTLAGGRDVLQTWLGVNGNVSYQGTENLNGTGAATLTVKADDMDGGGEVTLGTVAINITAVNDAPTGSGLPTSVVGTEGLARTIDLSGLSMADIDSPDADFVLILSTDYGTLAATTGHGVTVSGSGGATLGLTGTVADINAFLDRAGAVSLTTADGHTGTGLGTLTVTANDQDGSGSVALGTVAIDVRPPNNAPTSSGLPVAVTATEDAASTIDLSGLTLTDADSPHANFVLTVAADKGTLSATSGSGVTVGGSASGALTLTGSVAAINTFLDGTDAVKYTGAANAYGAGAATLTVTANDQDGNSNVALGTVRVDITPVNDAPTATGLPARATVTEDVATAIDLSGLALSEVDATDDDFKLVLSVTAGSLAATSASGVTVTGAGTATLTLSGFMPAVQAWLATSSRVTYTGAADANGTDADTLTVTGDDLDGSGAVAFGTVAIDITPANDAPRLTDLPPKATVYKDETGKIAFGSVGLIDVDDASETLTVALTVDVGKLSAASASGVTVAGTGSDTLLLMGTASAIETFLRGSQVSFTPTPTATEATLSVQAKDGEGATATGAMDIKVENRPPPPPPPPPEPQPPEPQPPQPQPPVAEQPVPDDDSDESQPDADAPPPPPRPTAGDGSSIAQPRPDAPPPAALSGPVSTDTPVSLAFQGASAGGGTGEVASAILGRLGSVSGIEASGTPVGQSIRLQPQSSPQGTAGGLGTPPPTGRTGGILGGAFGGLGVLGRTDGMNGSGGLDRPGGLDGPGRLDGLDGLDEPGDMEAPGLDGLADAGDVPDGDGHRGLGWQLTAARNATGEPVAALANALEALASGRTS